MSKVSQWLEAQMKNHGGRSTEILHITLMRPQVFWDGSLADFAKLLAVVSPIGSMFQNCWPD